MKSKFKSARVARRKTIRLGYQCIASARAMNKRYKDGRTTAVIVGVVRRVRGYKIGRFDYMVV